MMFLFVAGFIGMVVVGLVVRRRRAVMLSGLNAERPQFMVVPPVRRVGKRSGGRL